MATPAKVQPSQLRSHGWMCIVAMMSSGPAGVGIGGVRAVGGGHAIGRASLIGGCHGPASTPPMPTPAGPKDIIATMHIQPWDLSWLGWTLAGAAIAWL